MAKLLDPDEPPACMVRNAEGASPFVLLCEHASNRLPRRLGTLGLAAREIARHIGWDIGALALAEALSRRLDAPLFATGYSRLAIDCNRPLGVPSSIPEASEATAIPGNRDLAAEERAAREEALFHPFHDAVAAHLDARRAAGRASCVVGVHSFTPVFDGMRRPWQAGILYGAAAEPARALIAGLRGQGLTVGDNEPYGIVADEDYTVPVHGDARGLPAFLVEIRQDLLADAAAAEAWAGRLSMVLEGAVARLGAAA